MTDNETEITPELENLDDFLKETKLQMHVLLAHENPYRAKIGQEGSLHYSCKLINDKNEAIVIYFSKGLGIRLWKEPTEGLLSEGVPHHVPQGKVGQLYDGPQPPFENERDKEIWARCSAPQLPYLKEVFLCLANDIRNVELTGSFERWAKLMQTTPDSRIARDTFDLILRQRADLRRLLGEEAYHRLLYETELK